MSKLEKFSDRWERVGKLSQIVTALDKNDDYEDAFQGYWREFVEDLQSWHENISGRIARLIPVGNIRNQLASAKNYLSRYRNSCLKYGLKNLEDIIDDLGDNVKDVAYNVVPIKTNDMDKSDDLDKLIKNYKDSVDRLKDNLRNINQNTDPDRYNMQMKAIQEYEGYKNLLKDYKDLVENILGFRELASYKRGEDGKPDVANMKKLFDSYLNGLLEEFKNDEEKYDDNALIVDTIRDLSEDVRFFAPYYDEYVLKPAREKLESVAEGYDLKDYVERNIRVRNANEQVPLFDIIYGLSKQGELKKIQESKEERNYKLYGFKKAT